MYPQVGAYFDDPSDLALFSEIPLSNKLAGIWNYCDGISNDSASLRASSSVLAAPVALSLHTGPHAARAPGFSAIPESIVLDTLPKQQRKRRRLPLASTPQYKLRDLLFKAGNASDY